MTNIASYLNINFYAQTVLQAKGRLSLGSMH